METILLTGFEPFDRDLVNPSWEAVRQLDGMQLDDDVRIVARRLPCAFATAGDYLAQLIAELSPVMVIATGLGPGRSDISIERVAINVNDARIPDNCGAQPIDTPVQAGGPAAYFASLPIKAMLRAVQRAGVPCEVSQTAGTFVCNHVLYGLMHLLAQGAVPAGARGGFVHVPWVTGQGTPHLPLRDMVRGIHAALWAAVLAPQDIALQAGATQ